MNKRTAIAIVCLASCGTALGQYQSQPSGAVDYAQTLHEESLVRQRAVMGEVPNQWDAFLDTMTRLEPFVEQNAEADREAMQAAPESDWAGMGMTTIYMVPRDGSRTAYKAERHRAVASLATLGDDGLFAITAELMDIAVAMPPLQNKPLDFTQHNFASDARALSRIQLARMYMAGNNDAERLAALAELLALSRQIAWHGSVIDWLVGKAMAQQAAQQFLLSLLLHPAADDATLARADALIATEAIRRSPGIDFVLLTTRLMNRDLLDRTHDRDGGFVRSDIAEAALAWNDEASYEEPYVSRDVLAAWFDELHDSIDDAANATGEHAADAFAAAKTLAEATPNSPLAAFATPINLALVEQSSTIELAGARVVVAIERYRLAHDGTPPPSLDALGELLPQSLRTDPLTGTPWIYDPTPMTIDVESQPLTEGSTAWPYSLRSAPLPGIEPATHLRINPQGGVPITRSIQAPQYDAP